MSMNFISQEGRPSNARRTLKRAAAGMVSISLLVTGCAVGPNYKKPPMPSPASFGNADQPGIMTNRIDLAWWKSFQDATLEKLVERALTNNPDVRIASANLLEARALYRNAQFDLLPSAEAFGSYNNEKLSKASVFGLPNAKRHLELYDVGFDATWELDVFGRVRREVESNAALMRAAAANLRDMQVTLVSEIARNYFEFRGAQRELDVAKRNATTQTESLKITQARLDAGGGMELDVARGRAQLENTLALIPPLEGNLAAAVHRMSVLCGLPPVALKPELDSAPSTLVLPQTIDIGSPAEMLRRRPDVQEAEDRLAAATAKIGVAVADLFPRVTFNGQAALEASTLSGLGSAGSDTWSFGPRISWAALDLGHVRARIRAANARAESSVGEYEKVVLNALEETENALVNFGREQVRRNHLREAVAASERAAQLAQIRFENGATDFLTVLDAQRVLLLAQDQLAQSETRTADAMVAVYKALGGRIVAPESTEVSNVEKRAQ
jgi:multidrug efflux system outer membrane protein